MEQKKRIAVLTSGGDAPGMNACIHAVVRSAIAKGMEVFGVRDGYLGLITNDIIPMDRDSVTNISYLGGTVLGSARLPEFAQDDVALKGVENLQKLGIDALVAIGGDGTYRGAQKLAKFGIKVIGLPGTIDNDIASSEITIGFDTAVNCAMNALDAIRDTANSHNRCQILEVMGRYCGDISYAAGIAGGVDLIINSDTGLDEQKIFDFVNKCKEEKRRHVLICITEHITDVSELAKKIEAATGYVTRSTVLGHTQRGGRPTAFDRVLASRMGEFAVDQISQGITGMVVGLKGNSLVLTPIEDGFKMEKRVFKDYAIKVNEAIR